MPPLIRVEVVATRNAVLIARENGTTNGTSSSANPITTALQKCIAASIKTAAFGHSANPSEAVNDACSPNLTLAKDADCSNECSDRDRNHAPSTLPIIAATSACIVGVTCE